MIRETFRRTETIRLRSKQVAWDCLVSIERAAITNAGTWDLGASHRVEAATERGSYSGESIAAAREAVERSGSELQRLRIHVDQVVPTHRGDPEHPAVKVLQAASVEMYTELLQSMTHDYSRSALINYTLDWKDRPHVEFAVRGPVEAEVVGYLSVLVEEARRAAKATEAQAVMANVTPGRWWNSDISNNVKATILVSAAAAVMLLVALLSVRVF